MSIVVVRSSKGRLLTAVVRQPFCGAPNRRLGKVSALKRSHRAEFLVGRGSQVDLGPKCTVIESTLGWSHGRCTIGADRDFGSSSRC